MADIQNLNRNVVRPIELLSKTNEIIDTVNEGINSSYSEQNPLLIVSEGVCTWIVTHGLNTENVSCTVYQDDSEVLAEVEITSVDTVTITINSSSDIAAETYSVLILSKGGVSSYNNVSITVDSELSSLSENPVQNKVIKTVLDTKLDADKVQDIYSASSIYPMSGKALASALSVKRYRVIGEIITADEGGTVRGMGIAGVNLYGNGIAEIQFSSKILTGGTSTTQFNAGLSRDVLHSLNNKIPIINVIDTWGHIQVFTGDGYVSSNANGYGIGVEKHGNYWGMGRVYYDSKSSTYKFGGWPDNAFHKDYYLQGIVYGTYTV